MKLLAIMITTAMIFFGAQFAFALSGSVDAGLFPSEASAVSAAKNVLSDINKGTNQEVNASSNCYGSDAQADGFKVESVWQEKNTGFEKMYRASVDYMIQCDTNAP